MTSGPDIVDQPRPGLWAVRRAPGAREVAAAIMVEHTTYEPGNPSNLMCRSPFLVGYLEGKIVSPLEVWTMRRRPIDMATYRFLLEDVAWAKENAPGSSLARTRERVDLRTVPVPVPR